MQLKELKKISHIDKVKLHSLESNLYQLSIVIGEKEEYIKTNEGRFLTSHYKLDLQAVFKGKSVGAMVLCHQSAYDEMVGQPIGVSNALEVPLGNTELS